MFHCPDKYKIKLPDVNKELYQLEGVLSEKEARITLAKFLRHNLSIATHLLTGINLEKYQEVIIKGFFNRHFSMFVASRGGSKCESYNSNTFVLEKNLGMVPLTQLIPNIDFSLGERWIDIETVYLWNGVGWQNTSKVLIQPNVATKTVKTNWGYTLSGSTNHLIKCWDINKCDIVWKRFGELKNNDYVCIDRSEPYYGEQVASEDINEAYLIGLLIGDGSFSKSTNNINFTSADKELLDFVKQYPSGNILDKKNTICKAINISTVFSNYLYNKYKITKCDSYDKYIPSEILKNKQLLKACIQGLLDSDGYITKSKMEIGFTTTSVILAQQVHLLLLHFGIVASLNINKTSSLFGKSFRVKIGGHNVIKFYTTIGFRLSRKQNILIGHIDNKKKRNTNIDIIPGLKEYCHKIGNPFILSRNFEKQWNKNYLHMDQTNLSYYTLDKYIKFFEQENIPAEQIDHLNNIKNQNFFFDKIIEITNSHTNCIDFNIPTGECYWSNGFISHNSFIASIYIVLQMIFEPNTRILIVGPTFRTARNIFEQIERWGQSPEGRLMAQCFIDDAKHKTRRNDLFQWFLPNGSSLKAIPLNSEKVRGFRTDVLILDEFLLLPEEIVKTVLMPFLVSPQNVKERIGRRKIEDAMIRRGIMKEEDRIQFSSNIKMIPLSSASFTFEFLYKLYQKWEAEILDLKREILKDDPEIKVLGAKYFIAQMGYESLPEHMIDKNVIEEAQGDISDAIFDREYRALFTDGSASYFSFQKMTENTLHVSQSPHAQLVGERGKKYILSVDPNFSNSPTSDFFAMSLLQIDDSTQTAYLVHSYAKAGVDLKQHIYYFYYFLTNFNVVMVILDHADGNFLAAANESQLFQEAKLELTSFEFDSSVEGDEYIKEIQKAQNSYNLEAKKICFNQHFGQDNFIRRSNELLQTNIDRKRIFWASGINGNDTAFEKAEKFGKEVGDAVIKNLGEDNIIDLIDTVDNNIYGTKKECSLIEVKTNPQGNQTFDLPLKLKKSTSPNRARRDRYTALLLGNWAVRSYFDIKNTNTNVQTNTFEPFMIR